MTMRCRFPGCNRQIISATTSGVCRHHNHQKPWCLCTACTRQPKQFLNPNYRPPKKRERTAGVTPQGIPGSKIRQVQERNMTIRGVSLPMPPWEMPHD